MVNIRFAAGASLAALALMLAACGGGEVNSTPTPTGGSGSPTPTPGSGSPTPTPGSGSPTPTPGSGAPTPTPGSGSPTPTPGSGSPTPTPGGGSPTPTQSNSTVPSFAPALAVTSSTLPEPPPGPGGGVIIVVPTPTPTTPANDDLLSPLESERFSALGVEAIASIEKPALVGEIGSGPLGTTISYDAATQTYTVRDFSFGPADIVDGASDAHFTTFRKISGNSGQSLVLSRPGTSGQFTYRYVGVGFLQQVQEYSDLLKGYVHVFAYGVTTPDGSVPRSGSGNYSVDMLGLVAADGAVHNLYGSGTLGVNFASGAITTSGTAKQYAQTGSFEVSRDWAGSAQMYATTNYFQGNLTISEMSEAEWYGKFFGPGAQEVGSVFQATNGGQTVVGALIGRTSGQ